MGNSVKKKEKDRKQLNEVFRSVAWRTLSAVAVVLWGMVIFSFSAQNSSESSHVSETLCYAIADEYNAVFKQQLSEEQLWGLAELIEHPIRKGAHMTEYAIFALLLYHALCAFGIKGKKRYPIVLALILLYAATDELHQLYVSGRSAQVTDVLIDALGGAIMLFFIWVIRLWSRRKHKRLADQ